VVCSWSHGIAITIASNRLTLCFLVTVFFPAMTLTFSHSSFLFLTFVFNPWDFYSLGQKINLKNKKI